MEQKAFVSVFVLQGSGHDYQKTSDKYCSLLEKENGVHLLEKVLADPRPYRAIRRLAQHVLSQMDKRTSWTEQQGLDLCVTDSDQDQEGEEEEEENNLGAVGGSNENNKRTALDGTQSVSGGIVQRRRDVSHERGQGDEEKVKLNLDGDMENFGFIDTDSEDDIRL